MSYGCDACLDTGFAEDGTPCLNCDPQGEEYLPHNVQLVDGRYIAFCCSCEREIEVDADQLPAFGDEFYCGGSPRCIP